MIELTIELDVKNHHESYEKCGMDGYWKKMQFANYPPVGTIIWPKLGPKYQDGCYDGHVVVTGYAHYETSGETTVRCELVDEFDLEDAGWVCGTYPGSFC